MQTIQDSIVTDVQLVVSVQRVLGSRLVVPLALTQMLEVFTNQFNVTNANKVSIVPLLDLYTLICLHVQLEIFAVTLLDKLQVFNYVELASTVLWDQSSNLPVHLVNIKTKLGKEHANLVKSVIIVHILLIYKDYQVKS